MLESLILGVCLIGALVFHAWQAQRWSEERRMLVNSVVARTPGELTVLQKATEPVPAVERARAKESADYKAPPLPFGL